MFFRRADQFTGILLVLFSIVTAGFGQEVNAYKKPPDPITSILDRSTPPAAMLDPSGRSLLLIFRSSLPGIEELSRPTLRLAGKRFLRDSLAPILPRNGPITALNIIRIDDKSKTVIDTPDAVRIESPAWSPDGEKVAYACIRDNTVEIWVFHLDEGESKLLIDGVNLASGQFSWFPDSKRILCRVVPSGRGTEPDESEAPKGPIILNTSETVSQTRTYQDLLRSPMDLARYEYYLTTQLVIADASSGDISPIGDPAIFDQVSISPNGEKILVEKIRRPYSYMVPESYFPRRFEIWNLKGKTLKIIAEIGLNEGVPIDGVRQGPRSIEWISCLPDSLVWVEALDGGDPKNEAEFRDKIVMLRDVLGMEPTEIIRLTSRYSPSSRSEAFSWLEDGRGLISELDRKKQWIKTWLVHPDQPDSNRLLWERNRYDAYNDPGRPLMKTMDSGQKMVYQEGSSIFLAGQGASKTGYRPFLDSMNLEDLTKTRIYQSSSDSYESVEAMLPGRRLMTRFETADFPPNYFLLDLKTSEKRQITDFEDPVPELRGLSQQLIRYWREDGVELSGTLYLPSGYKEGTRIPLIMWAYPREYTDPKVASQVRGSPNRFTTVTGPSHLFFATQGYAVLDGPAMPIVGEQGNDTFVEQLVLNAKAAIDKVVDLGITSREQIGIGGHSYGAFMTANLLAHSDFFAAGIARSGAYNRTLTPFGFQNESRTFWEAPEVYFDMSPFMHVDRINEPLLLIHGEADNNSGTFPIQSSRLFHAIKGFGGTARLVILPYESHGYVARESVLHTLAEMVNWFDKYLKKAD